MFCLFNYWAYSRSHSDSQVLLGGRECYSQHQQTANSLAPNPNTHMGDGSCAADGQSWAASVRGVHLKACPPEFDDKRSPSTRPYTSYMTNKPTNTPVHSPYKLRHPFRLMHCFWLCTCPAVFVSPPNRHLSWRAPISFVLQVYNKFTS